MDQKQIDQLETEESMFVQTARGITSDGATLTLRDVTPSTLFFSDRPQRVVGHMTTADFVELWGEGDNSFEADPPNAVLSFVEPGADAPTDAVDRDQEADPQERAALVLHRCPRRNHSDRGRTRHLVHRPVRAATVARIGMRRAPPRTPAGPAIVPRLASSLVRRFLSLQPNSPTTRNRGEKHGEGRWCLHLHRYVSE